MSYNKIRLDKIIAFNPRRIIKKGTAASFVEMAGIPEGNRDISYTFQKEFIGSGCKFRNGDTLFARITPCLENGKTAKVNCLKKNEVAHGSTEFIVFSAKEPAFDEDFIYYLCRWPKFREFAKSRMEGTSGRQRVDWKVLAESEWELPEKEVRKEIGFLLKQFDDKISNNNHINQTLEEIAQALFKSWFVDFDPVKAKIEAKAKGVNPHLAAMIAISGKTEEEIQQLPEEYQKELAKTAALFPDDLEESELGMIPKGWKITSFGKVTSCFDSKRIPLSKRERDLRKGQYRYIGATSVMDYIDDFLFDGTFLLMGEDGSVIKEDGTPFLQYVWGKFWVNNHAHVLVGKSTISTEQLLLFLRQTNISEYVTGAVQLKLNQKNMNSIPFILSTKEINNKFQMIINQLFKSIKNLTDENKILEEQRDTLIPKLLSGELTINKI